MTVFLIRSYVVIFFTAVDKPFSFFSTVLVNHSVKDTHYNYFLFRSCVVIVFTAMDTPLCFVLV